VEVFNAFISAGKRVLNNLLIIASGTLSENRGEVGKLIFCPVETADPGKNKGVTIRGAGVMIREAGQIFARPGGEPETA